MNIRTSIAFNRDYDSTFTYDKQINAGNRSEYYENQDNLQVRYIDYFNDNNGSDYLGNNYYTYNNLAGLRTLEINNTDYYFNFLDVGYFTDLLNFYTPPVIPEPLPIVEPTTPTTTYWYYQSITLETDTTETIEIGNWSFDYTLIKLVSKSAKFYYETESISYIPYGAWYDFVVNAIKFLTNTIIMITNLVLLFFQFVLYLGVLAFNYIIMFLIVGLLSILIWNILLRALFIAGVGLLWLIYYALQWLFYEGLEGLIIALAIVFAWIMAVILWLITLCTANFDDLFNMVNDVFQEIATFMVDLFYEIALNIGIFFLFLTFYAELCLFLLYKMYIAKAKGNIKRADSLQKAFEVFITPLRSIWNMIISIKNFLFGWL